MYRICKAAPSLALLWGVWGWPVHLRQESVDDDTSIISPSPCSRYVSSTELFIWGRYIWRVEDLHTERVLNANAL